MAHRGRPRVVLGLVARVVGDEFAIPLAQTPAHEAAELAAESQAPLTCTASVPRSALREITTLGSGSIDILVREADRRL